MTEYFTYMFDEPVIFDKIDHGGAVFSDSASGSNINFGLLIGHCVEDDLIYSIGYRSHDKITIDEEMKDKIIAFLDQEYKYNISHNISWYEHFRYNNILN